MISLHMNLLSIDDRGDIILLMVDKECNEDSRIIGLDCHVPKALHRSIILQSAAVDTIEGREREC